MTTVAPLEARLLAGLDADQREAVMSPAMPLAVLATAGAGKTGVLTRRIARRLLDGTADAEHVLALTFTRQAAGELVRRLQAFGFRERIQVGTFHGVALRVLQQRWDDLGKPRPKLVTDKIRIVETLDSRLKRQGAAEVVAEIEWARSRAIAPRNYIEQASAQRRNPTLAFDRIAELFEAYRTEKSKRRVIDFDDLLELCHREIQSDATFAAVQQWRFRHLFVDEFQDINPLQFRLLEQWRARRSDLCIVGDPNQAIYGWNGADPTLCRDIETTYPGVSIIRLNTNYRSSPEVIEAARAIIGESVADVRSAKPSATPIEIHRFADEAAEADGIASIVQAARRPGQAWTSVAVLARTNAQLPPIAAELARRGIPTSRPATTRVDPAVAEALRDLQGDNPADVRDWLADLLDRCHDPDLDTKTLSALTGLIQEASELIAIESSITASDLRNELAADGDGVRLVTFHAAKGLEWDTVVVAGMERGLVPHASATNRDSVDEETRLLYVATTRATRRLVYTLAQRRDGKSRQRFESPFLAALHPLASGEPIAAPPPRERARAKPPTEPLVEWRTRRAQAVGVPADAILPADALARLLIDRPTTQDGLAVIVGQLAARRFGTEILPLLNRCD